MELIVDSVLCGWTWYNILWPSGFQLVSELQSRFSGGTGRLFLSRSEPLHRTGRRPAGAPPGESLSSRPGHCCQPVATESSVCHCRRRCCWLAGGLQAVAKDLSPVHTSDNVEATLSNATSWTILSTVSNVASTLLLVWTGPYTQLRLLYKVLLTLPVTTTSVERGFSKLTVVKSKLRSAMGQGRLQALILSAVEEDILLNLNDADLVARFAGQASRRN